jgi:hypothetical protein
MGIELMEHLLDYKGFKDKTISNNLDTGSSLEAEIMTARLESKDIYEKLN